MPTHEELSQFLREFSALPASHREMFVKAMRQMVEDLRAKRPFRASLRVKSVTDYPGIFEMTWEKADGRATFRYGSEKRSGETHIIWRRVGGHEIFNNP